MATPPNSQAATIHQTGATMPKLDAPLVDEGGNITPWWYRLLTLLWQRTGGATPLPYSGFIALNPATAQYVLYAGGQATPVGNVTTNSITGGPVEIPTPGPSPWVFTATAVGTLFVGGAQVAVRRGPVGVWHQFSVQGGAVPLLNGDAAQLTWFGHDLPTVAWFPDATT